MDPADSERRFDSEQAVTGRTFGLLLGSSLIASLLLIPYNTAIITASAPPSRAPLWLIVAVTLISTLFISSGAIAVGLSLGKQIGLGAPILQDWVAGDPNASRRFRGEAPIAIGVGLVIGIVLTLLLTVVAPLLPHPKAPITHPSPWQGLLASISAGVNEEIWLRLGLMTFVAWVVTRISGGKNVGPVAGWTSIILATLIFGALHLPQASMLMGLNLPVIVLVLAANGLAGIAFGWLYWRRSLIAAMLAHFATDVILHVLAPALSFIR
jgi:hypothetical protein